MNQPLPFSFKYNLSAINYIFKYSGEGNQTIKFIAQLDLSPEVQKQMENTITHVLLSMHPAIFAIL